jgi:hypothetical protein
MNEKNNISNQNARDKANKKIKVSTKIDKNIKMAPQKLILDDNDLKKINQLKDEISTQLPLDW